MMFTDARISIAYRAKCPTKRASAWGQAIIYPRILHHDPALSKIRRDEMGAEETSVKQA